MISKKITGLDGGAIFENGGTSLSFIKKFDNGRKIAVRFTEAGRGLYAANQCAPDKKFHQYLSSIAAQMIDEIENYGTLPKCPAGMRIILHDLWPQNKIRFVKIKFQSQELQ